MGRDRYVNVALGELRRALKNNDKNDHAHFLFALVFMYKGQRSAEERDVLQCLRGPESDSYRKEANGLMTKALEHLRIAFKLRKMSRRECAEFKEWEERAA